jgi:uncharacterized protein
VIFLLINIEKLKQESKHFLEVDTNVEPEEIDLKNDGIVEPVKINCSVRILGEEVLLEGEYETTVEYQCVRCLEKFKETFKGKIETIFYSENSDDYNDEQEEYFDGDVIKEPLVNGKIDIVEFVRECILLDMEQYPICSKECKGVEKLEEYDNKGIDPRWQQLINIIKDNK